jgi:hypothetical protein
MHQFAFIQYDCFVTVILRCAFEHKKVKGRGAYDSTPALASGVKALG